MQTNDEDEQQPLQSATNTTTEWHVETWELVALLIVNCFYFGAALVFSQLTHSLTLLVDSYQALYGIGLLIICLLDIKAPSDLSPSGRRRQTFSWARIQLVGKVMNITFLVSLLFATLVETIQTLAHVHHLDAMHHPKGILAFACVRLALSVVNFAFFRRLPQRSVSGMATCISSPSCHRQCLPDPDDDVLTTPLQQQTPPTDDNTSTPLRRLFLSTLHPFLYRWMAFIGLGALVPCALTVIGSDLDAPTALYIDPALTLVAIVAFALAIAPLGSRLAFHLLLGVPEDIFPTRGSVAALREAVMRRFPAIVDVHSLRVWRHDPSNLENVIFTCHVVLRFPLQYTEAFAARLQRFMEQALLSTHDGRKQRCHKKQATCVTVQPEFYPIGLMAAAGETTRRYPCQSVCCEKSVRQHRKKLADAQLPVAPLFTYSSYFRVRDRLKSAGAASDGVCEDG